MTHRGSILLVDDEEKILKALGRALRDAGHAVVETASPRQAQRLLGERTFDVLIVDNVMPELSGLDLIREFVASTPEGERPQILMMTAHATVESALEAMKLGALDYLQKPFEIDELLVVVRRALEHQRLRTEYRYLVNERDEQFDHYGIVGRSRAMEEVIKRAELVAETKSTVLITGETGTGKELVARAIHDRSAQRDMPLIKVNCAAIPETLLESELFGHVRGAFTGATTTKKGKFALADGGTIFLDEIGTMSPTLQSKLLRVLQEREVEPLGSERTEKIDVRVIAATNRDLRQMVADGKFQEDLFYRLNVIPIEIPPLRERRDDIPALVEHFVKKHAQRTGRRFDKMDEAVLTGLQQYDWPGNVRELENTIERAVVLSPGPAITARAVAGRAAVAEAATEHRVGRARDDPPRAGKCRRRQEGCRRTDGHQPAGVVVLPGEVPVGVVADVTCRCDGGLRQQSLGRRVHAEMGNPDRWHRRGGWNRDCGRVRREQLVAVEQPEPERLHAEHKREHARHPEQHHLPLCADGHARHPDHDPELGFAHARNGLRSAS
jgi:DNA-binding NtrC family response regulator